jgi:putative ABC transport system permease protein
MYSFLRDLRFGMRMLYRKPGFSLIVISLLTVAISCGNAIFGVVYSVLVRPLPYVESGRLAMLWVKDMEDPQEKSTASSLDLGDWRSQSSRFRRIEAFTWDSMNLVGTGEPDRLPVMQVSTGFLQMLDVQPFLGRTFATGEDSAGGGHVVILSHDLWQQRFSSSSSAQTKTIQLNGQGYTIIGVMPAGFAESFVSWPDSPHQAPAIWIPLRPQEDTINNRAARVLDVVGQLKTGVTLEAAQAEMTTISARLARQYPLTNAKISVSVVSLRDDIVGDVRPTVRVLASSVGFLLLIAYANVATLLVAQAADRQKEISIRIATGASQMRVVRQLLNETLPLTFISCILGFFLSWILIRLFLGLGPADLPRMNEVHLDGRVLVITLFGTFLTILAFGLLPTWYGSKKDFSRVLAQGRGNLERQSFLSRARTVLVTFEISTALLLLICALLMIRSFLRVEGVGSGIENRNLLTTGLRLDSEKYRETSQRMAFFKELLSRVRALPGVKSADVAYSIPFGTANAKVFFSIAGKQPSTKQGWPPVDFNVVSPGLFQTLGVPLQRGRNFAENDAEKAPKVVIINQEMARQFWNGLNPVGSLIGLDMPSGPQKDLMVVGVVADVRQRGLDEEVQPCIYVSYLQFPTWTQSMHLLVRTAIAPLVVAPDLRKTVWSIDKDQPLIDLNSMEQMMSTSVASRRFNMVLLQILAAAALILAFGGVYGLTVYLMTQRRKEIAIRVALGAEPNDVLKSFFNRNLKPVVGGVIVGTVIAFATTRFMHSLLFGISPTDPFTFVAASALVAVLPLAATLIPTRKTAQISPASLLREE